MDECKKEFTRQIKNIMKEKLLYEINKEIELLQRWLNETVYGGWSQHLNESLRKRITELKSFMWSKHDEQELLSEMNKEIVLLEQWVRIINSGSWSTHLNAPIEKHIGELKSLAYDAKKISCW